MKLILATLTILSLNTAFATENFVCSIQGSSVGKKANLANNIDEKLILEFSPGKSINHKVKFGTTQYNFLVNSERSAYLTVKEGKNKSVAFAMLKEGGRLLWVNETDGPTYEYRRVDCSTQIKKD